MQEKLRGLWARYRTWTASLSRPKRILFRTAQVLLLLVLIGWLALNLFSAKPSIPGVPVGTDGPGSGDLAQSGRRSDVFTFLLVGKDTAGGGNTDTMILATFDTRAKTLHAISLPRDTMVNVSWRTKKLNTVYNYNKGKDKATQVENGMAALKDHVAKLTGVLPDYYAIVEWDAVGEIVDAIGGVTFDVPYDMHYDDDTPGQDLHIHQEKGLRKLSGEDAMQVIRWRKNNGEYGKTQIGDAGRMKVQQDFLKAMVSQCLQAKNILNIPALADIILDNVTTDLSAGNMVWLAQQAVGMDVGQSVHFHTMPYTNYARGTAYVLPVVDELLVIINSGLNPYKRDVQAGDLEVLQLNNGRLTLTSGTMADSSMAQAQKPTQQPAVSPKPETPPEAMETEPTPAEPDSSAEAEVPEEIDPPAEPQIPAEPQAPAEPEQPAESAPSESMEEVAAKPEPDTEPVQVEQTPTGVLPSMPAPVEE